MDSPLAGVAEIGRRLGMKPAAAWRRARLGHFGPPAVQVLGRGGSLLWQDDDSLALLLENIRRGRAEKKARPGAWARIRRGQHVKRLAGIAAGEIAADGDDKKMAVLALRLCLFVWQRRRDGCPASATSSALFVTQRLQARKLADAPHVEQCLLAAIDELAGNSRVPPVE